MEKTRRLKTRGRKPRREDRVGRMPQLELEHGHGPGEREQQQQDEEQHGQDDFEGMAEEACPRGLAKMVKRNLNWLSFSKRRRLLALGAIASNQMPRSTRDATGYFLFIHKVEGWHIPPGLVTKVTQAKTDLRYSASLTFYHIGSKRFFGTTVMGQQVEGLSTKELLKKGEDTNAALPANAPAAPVVINVTHDEIWYWYSRVVDQDCLALLELVASEVEPRYGVALNQYACGWAILRPFGNPSIKDADEDDPESKVTFETSPVYRGTPRQLLFFTDQDWVNLKSRVVPGCTVQFKLRKYRNLLRAMHLFSENEVLSAVDMIPGLQRSTVRLPSGHKCAQAPILAADVQWRGKRQEGNCVVGPAKPLLAPTYTVHMLDIQVLVPGRRGLEKELLSTLVSELPNMAKEAPTFRTFSFTRRQMQLVEEVAVKDRQAVILSRFLKVGLHNGRTLLRQPDDDNWIYLKLDTDDDEDEDTDLLSHYSSKETKLAGFFKHRYCALVFLLEYSIRIGARKGRAEDRESKSQAKEGVVGDRGSVPSVVKIPIILGGGCYTPCDGKRLRLRNMPVKANPSLELELLPDEHCRSLTTDLVFTPAKTQSLLKTMKIQEPMLLGCNLQVRDQKDHPQPDETPLLDADESDEDVKEKREGAVKKSDESGSSGDDETSVGGSDLLDESSRGGTEEESETEEEDEAFSFDETPREKGKNKDKHKSLKRKEKHHEEEHDDDRKHKPKAKMKKRPPKLVDETSSEDYPLSLISGDSVASYLRRRAHHRRKYRHLRPPSPASDLSEFEQWRGGIHVPADKGSLLGKSLQVALHGPARQPDVGQTEPSEPKTKSPAKPIVAREPLETVANIRITAFNPELSRAAKTRLSRYGFTDVVQESSIAAGAVVLPPEQKHVVSMEVELSDELSRNEITLQFAALRVVRPEDRWRVPESVFFTYQFYRSAPTKTEVATLKEDQLGDRLTFVLLRETEYGRDAPAKAYRHVIDLGGMYEAEARSFVEYLSNKALHIDVWDGHSLLLLGSLSIPLWRFMRQGNVSTKISHEYEVLEPLGLDNDSGSVTIDSSGSSSRVMGFVQLLACNYGEPSDTRPPGPSIERPLQSFHNRIDWRLQSKPPNGGFNPSASDSSCNRPKRRVRARPLAESNKDVASMLESSHLWPTRGSMTRSAASYRASADDRCVTYDELLLLFKRFRGPGKALINYRERLLDLLCIPSVHALEKKFLRLVTKAEESGASLEEVFRSFDKNKDGMISLSEMEEALRGMGGMTKLRPVEVRMLLKRFESRNAAQNQPTGKVNLRSFIEFVRSRQPETNVELKLKRVLAKATLAGKDLEAVFTSFAPPEADEITVDNFKRALESLGSLASSLLSAEVEKVARKLDGKGSGKIQLDAIAKVAGHLEGARPWRNRAVQPAPSLKPSAAVEEKLKRILQRAKDDGLSVVYAFKHFDKEGTGYVSEAEFEQGLRQLGVFKESDGELRAVVTRWKKEANGKVSWSDFLRWAGEPHVATEELLEDRLIKSFVKAEEMGLSLEGSLEQFDPEHTGFITPASLEAGVRSLGKFHSLDPKDVSQLFGRWDKEKSGKVGLESLKAYLQPHMQASRISTKARKRQILLSHLRDNLISAVSSNRDLTAAKLLQGLERKGANKDLLSVSDFEAALGRLKSTDSSMPAPLDVSAAFSASEPGHVSVKAFEEWWKAAVVVPTSREQAEPKSPTPSRQKEGKDDADDADGDDKGESRGRAASVKGARSPSRRAGHKDQERHGDDGKKGDDKEDDRPAHSARRSRRTQEDESEEEQPEGDMYEYSKDLETREVEKKLRRGARAILRQGLDIEAFFKDYDPDGTGAVQRADFVGILMELGLSLVDGPGLGQTQGKAGMLEGDKLRERQMAQLAAIQAASGERLGSRSASGHMFTPFGQQPNVAEDKQAADVAESLALIKLYREGQKRQAIRNMLMQSMRTTYRIFPRVGDTEFFEFPFRNPFPHEERFQIIINDPACELRIVQSSDEWGYLRHTKRPAVGDLWTAPVLERDMVDAGGANGIQLTLAGHEELPLPFCFITVNAATTSGKTNNINNTVEAKSLRNDGPAWSNAVRTVEVTIISASHGNVVVMLVVEVHVQPLTVDRVLRFYQGEGQILRRCVRFMSSHTSLLDAEDQDNTKYVHCLEQTTQGQRKSVVVEWRQADGITDEILIKYLCGPFPSVGSFFLLIYNDHYQAVLHDVWRVEIHSRLSANVHSLLGQSVPLDLPVKGDRFVRRVACYSSSPPSINFLPNSKLKIPPGGTTALQLRYRPMVVGQEKVQIHVVDSDTRELVYAWLLTVTSNPPVITKTYDVDVPVGQPAHKKIAYVNPWDKPRFYKLVSSDDRIMKPRYERLEIPPQEKAYVRVYFSSQEQVGARLEVFLFMNDAKDQNEECFLVRVRVVEV